MSNLLAVAILALATLIGLTVYVVRVFLTYLNRPPAPQPERSNTEQLEEDFESLRKLVEDLTLALDDGIRRVDRAENRIQKTVASSRAAVRKAGIEHAGIEAEFDQLEPPDAEPDDTMPALPEEVEEGRRIRIPGGHLTLGVG